METQTKKTQPSSPGEEDTNSVQCAHCGQPLAPGKMSVREFWMSLIFLAATLSLVAVLGYLTVEKLLPALQNSTHHLIWHEPLDDWNLN